MATRVATPTINAKGKSRAKPNVSLCGFMSPIHVQASTPTQARARINGSRPKTNNVRAMSRSIWSQSSAGASPVSRRRKSNMPCRYDTVSGAKWRMDGTRADAGGVRSRLLSGGRAFPALQREADSVGVDYSLPTILKPRAFRLQGPIFCHSFIVCAKTLVGSTA